MKLFENMSIQENQLYIGQHHAATLAKEHGTPLFVMDGDYIRKQCRKLKSHFQHKQLETEILYASKAFCSKSIYRLMQEEDMSIDVVSGGELYTAIQAGFPANRIYFHGNNKSMGEIDLAISYGVQRIIVDNLMELEYIASLEKTLEIMLRINPGIEAHTHEYVQTATESSKFGISFESYDLNLAINLIQNSSYLTLKGLHCHIGSQIHEASAFEKTAHVMLDQIKLLEHKYQLQLEELNLGGGFGVYYADDQPIQSYGFLTDLLDYIGSYCAKHQLHLTKVLIEPGRLLVANAGITLYQVGFTKTTLSGKSYVFVDGGMTDNIRPALYQAQYEACIANRVKAEIQEVYTLAGKCCESGDILIENITLPTVKQSDYLAVMSTGAYGYSMASQYNRIPKPAVILLEGATASTIIRRETYDDLVRYDL